MKYLTKLLLLIILTNFSSCDPSDNRLRLYNQTKYSYEYDVIMDCNLDSLHYYFNSDFLHPFDSTVYGSMSRWELEFKDSKTNQITILLMYDDSTNYYRMKYDSV